ncbi:MAG: hypothetical protein ACYSR5_10120, partial [Planctomycetota bacterium]
HDAPPYKRALTIFFVASRHPISTGANLRATSTNDLHNSIIARTCLKQPSINKDTYQRPSPNSARLYNNSSQVARFFTYQTGLHLGTCS